MVLRVVFEETGAGGVATAAGTAGFAELSPEERQECSALDARLANEQAMLKAKGDAATLQDEMPLVRSQKRYRQLHC